VIEVLLADKQGKVREFEPSKTRFRNLQLSADLRFFFLQLFCYATSFAIGYRCFNIFYYIFQHTYYIYIAQFQSCVFITDIFYADLTVLPFGAQMSSEYCVCHIAVQG